MIWVVEASHEGGHRLRVRFSDGSVGIADLRSLMTEDSRPIVRELADIQNFRAFRVDADTVVWENGMDLAPEYLYHLATGRFPAPAPLPDD